MQAEMPVERQRTILAARLRDRDRRAEVVISLVAIRHDDIEPVDRAAQHHDDEPASLALRGRGPGRGRECHGGKGEEIATVHGLTYSRMKSGLPSTSAARSGGGDSSMTARVRAESTGASRVSSAAASTGAGSGLSATGTMGLAIMSAGCKAAIGRCPPPMAVAKLTRCVVASGLSQAASVVLYPSGVGQP